MCLADNLIFAEVARDNDPSTKVDMIMKELTTKGLFASLAFNLGSQARFLKMIHDFFTSHDLTTARAFSLEFIQDGLKVATRILADRVLFVAKGAFVHSS
jgi:hypothetical protein